MRNKFIIMVHIGLVIAMINLVLVIAAPLCRLYLDLAPMTVFPVFTKAIRFGLLLAACGLLFTIISTFTRVMPAVRSGLFMMVFGLLPLGSVIATIGPERFRSPMIHDITTDRDNPPEFNKVRELRKPGENSLEYGGEEIATLQKNAFPDIKPVFSDLKQDEALSHSAEVIRTLGWTMVNIDPDNGIIEAYDTTRIFGFTDDIVIRIQSYGEGSRIDIRSISRIGLSDVGMNAVRIRRFVSAFNRSSR